MKVPNEVTVSESGSKNFGKYQECNEERRKTYPAIQTVLFKCFVSPLNDLLALLSASKPTIE